jgi:hypothetical protein
MIYVGYLSPDIDRLCNVYQNLLGLTEFADARTKLFRRPRIDDRWVWRPPAEWSSCRLS